MKEFWNERFEKEEFIYGTEPNAFFKAELDKMTNTGLALFPMEGEGRNSCYAAKKGWKVEAFDFSEAGKKKALKLCEKVNAEISYHIKKAEEFEFKNDKYDLIVLIYAHLQPELREDFHKKVYHSLKPGGKVILEGFHPKQLLENYPSGGPQNIDMLYTFKLLKADFKELYKIDGEELEIDLKEGRYHLGKGFVTRLIGIK